MCAASSTQPLSALETVECLSFAVQVCDIMFWYRLAQGDIDVTWYETTAGKSMGPGVRMKRNEAAHKDQISVDAVLCKLRFGSGRGTFAVKNLSSNVPLLPYSRIVWVRCVGVLLQGIRTLRRARRPRRR